MSYNLKSTHLKTLSISECRRLSDRKMEDFIYSTRICTMATDESRIGFGDVGSPLVVNGRLVGITYWDDQRKLGQFTRVSSIFGWIQEQMSPRRT